MTNPRLKQQAERLAIGLHAKCEDGKLVLTKHGKPFNKHRLVHSMDWMSGALYIYGKPYYTWDNTRYRRRPNRWDTEAYYLNLLAEHINQTAAKFTTGAQRVPS